MYIRVSERETNSKVLNLGTGLHTQSPGDTPCQADLGSHKPDSKSQRNITSRLSLPPPLPPANNLYVGPGPLWASNFLLKPIAYSTLGSPHIASFFLRINRGSPGPCSYSLLHQHCCCDELYLNELPDRGQVPATYEHCHFGEHGGLKDFCGWSPQRLRVTASRAEQRAAELVPES